MRFSIDAILNYRQSEANYCWLSMISISKMRVSLGPIE